MVCVLVMHLMLESRQKEHDGCIIGVAREKDAGAKQTTISHGIMLPCFFW